jgi:hypothetical protein
MTGDEMNVTKEGLPQEQDYSAFGHRHRQVLGGFNEIVGQVKGHAGLCLSFEEVRVRKQLRQALPTTSFLQMSGSES